MKYLSFRILILCILMPPMLYVGSLGVLQRYLEETYTREIEQSLIGDTGPLFNGTVRLTDSIRKNVDDYLAQRPLLDWGVRVNVRVMTARGYDLYPPSVLGDEIKNQTDSRQIAEQNYALMKEGIEVVVDMEIPHNTLLSNSFLGFFTLLSVATLILHYQVGVRRARLDEQARREEIERLVEQENAHRERLEGLSQARNALTNELGRIREELDGEKVKASRNEDEMIEEIDRLETKINENLAFQEEQQEQIEALKEQIALFEKGKLRTGKQKTKDVESLQRRLQTLYKNLSVNDRAIDGLLGLNEDLRIKAEEIIHQLNDDPNMVTIKRKVFSKKGRETVLEVLFAYKGRLYFRRRSTDNRIEVLTVGTKNTQAKDLQFLDNLSPG